MRMLTGTGGSSCRETEGQLKGRPVEPPLPSHCSPSPATHPALQLGLLKRGSHHRQDLGPERGVCSRPLLQDLGGRQGRLASVGPGTGLAPGSPSSAPEGGGGRVKLDSGKTSFTGDQMEVKNMGFGVGWTQVQTLALPLTSCRVTLDKLFQISLGLGFLPARQVWKLPSWATGGARAKARAAGCWHKVGARTWPWPLLMMAAQWMPPEVLE